MSRILSDLNLMMKPVNNGENTQIPEKGQGEKRLTFLPAPLIISLLIFPLSIKIE
jgi:hypothetical protein